MISRILYFSVLSVALAGAAEKPPTDPPPPPANADAAAAKLLQTARNDPDPFVRLAVEFLARTGLRKGELLDLTVNAVVQIGSAYWLRVPVGKLHSDRYIPLHPQLKALLDDWLRVLLHLPASYWSSTMPRQRWSPGRVRNGFSWKSVTSTEKAMASS